jgi:hypothetical protein
MEHQTGPDGAESSDQDWIEDGGSGLAWLRSFTEPDEESAPDEDTGPDEESALVVAEGTALAEDTAVAEEHAVVHETPPDETGEPRVDAALRLLERLPGLPVSDHPELFEQVHAQLAEVLSDLGSGLPGGPADTPRS